MHLHRLSLVSCTFIQESIAMCLLAFVYCFRKYVANFEDCQSTRMCWGDVLSDLKLKEVREKIVEEKSYRNIF